MPRYKQNRNVQAARNLRANMSLSEVLLWRELRQQSAVKFRRQHPLGSYILDFYCAAAKVCVEIDGQRHDFDEQPERDIARDKWLRDQGIEVIRIPAVEVLRSPSEIADALVRHCQR